MSGGAFAKLGLWFEGDYVCLQWLHMLAGTVDEVLWEPPKGADEPRVDLWLRERGRRIAIQCKTRSGSDWTQSEIAEVLEWGLNHLEREDGYDEFWFVYDACARLPVGLATWAAHDGLARCMPDLRRSGGNAIDELLKRHRPEVLARCFARPVSPLDLERQLQVMARELVTSPRMLIESLRALRGRALLSSALNASQLRAILDESRFEWRAFVPASLVDDARQESAKFVKAVVPASPLPRADAERLTSLFDDDTRGRTVLVHGNPGIGKSVVVGEAVQRWIGEGAQVLAFRADDIDSIAERNLVPEQLAVVWSPDRPRIVCIDQLDQVASVLGGGGHSGRKLLVYISAAAERGFNLILGARSVDADHDTLLRGVVSMGDTPRRVVEWDADSGRSTGNVAPSRLVSLRIGPLPEAVVAKGLESRQVAYWELPAKTRELVQNPLALRLFERVVGSAGWRAARTVHGLVEAWLREVLTPIEGGRDALDMVLDEIALRRATRVERILLDRHDSALQALVSAGVLIDERGGLRPLHQVFLDAHVAKKLGSVVGVDEVLERLGSSEGQGVLQATQLRYAVSRWVSRAPRLLDELFRTPHLRPLSRFALLLGLADESDAPTPELGQVIAGWLRDGLDTDWIMKVVLHGRGPWVHAVRDWIMTAWRPDEGVDERPFVELLASVAVTAGDLVADLLTSWAEVDPDVLRRARVLFFQSPTADTDRLFELRTSDPVLFAELHPYVDWPALVASHPARAARCFALLISSHASEAWLGWKDAAEGRRPKLADLKQISEALPGRLWREMRETWRRLEPGDLHTVQVGYDESGRPLISVVIEALGRDLALLLERGEIGWDELVESLPHPLRTLDRWLLVAVASAVEAQPLADRAWHWMDAQRVRHELTIDGLGRFTTKTLARVVAKHLSVRASPEFRGPIEAWREALGEDPNESAMTVEMAPLNSGYEPEELAGWSSEEWVHELRAATPRSGGRWKHTSKGLTSRDIDFLALGLMELVGADPRARLELAHTILDADPPVNERVLPYLVDGICRDKPTPRFATAQEWKPLSDGEAESVVAHPRVLASERCAVDLARIVTARALHPWPERVVARLISLALEPTEDERKRFMTSPERAQDLSRAMFEAPSSVALEAIAEVARHQAAHRERALRVGSALCGIGPNHRRLAAVKLAATLIVHLGRPAAEAVLAGCVDLAVAAHHDGLHSVLYTVDQFQNDPAIQAGVVQLMERLCASKVDELRLAGGRCAAALRWRGLVTDAVIERLRGGHSSVGLGMVDVLDNAISRGEAAPWMFELALTLADDADEHVVRATLDAVSQKSSDPLELPEGWLERLAATRAALLDPDDIIELAARRGAPSTVAGLVLHCARRFVEELGADAPTHWELSRRRAVDTLCSHLAQLLESESREVNHRSDIAREALALWERLLEKFPRLTVGRTRTFVG